MQFLAISILTSSIIWFIFKKFKFKLINLFTINTQLLSFLNKFIFSSIFLTTLIALFINYDFTDEAYLHSILLFKDEVVNLTYYQLLFGHLSIFFDGNIIFFRIISYLLVISSTIALVSEILLYHRSIEKNSKRKIKYLLIFSALFFPILGLTILSYNSLNVVGSILVMASAVSILNKRRINFYLLFILGYFLLFISRPPAILTVLLFPALCYLTIRREFKHSLYSMIILIFLCALFLSFNLEFFKQSIDNYSFFADSSHSNILLNYIKDILISLSLSLPFIAYLSLFKKEFLKSKNFNTVLNFYLIIVLLGFIGLILIFKENSSYAITIISISFIVINIYIAKLNYTNKAMLFLSIISILLPLSSSFSTNGDLVFFSSSLIIIYLIPSLLSILLYEIQIKKLSITILIVNLMLLVSSINVFYVNPYRSYNIFEKKSIVDFKPLKNLFIDNHLLQKINDYQ